MKLTAVPSLFVDCPKNAESRAKKRKLETLEPLEERCFEVESQEGGIGEESRVDGGRLEGSETPETEEAWQSGSQTIPSSACLPPDLLETLQSHVGHDHDYDEIDIVKLKKQLKRAREKIISYRRKIQILQRICRRRKKKCHSMKEVVAELKNRG